MRPGKKSILKRFLKPFLLTIVLGVLTYSVLVLYGDANKIGDSLHEFKWHFFFIGLLLATSNYLLRFIKWSFYLRCLEIRLPAFESLTVFLSGFVVSVTPAKVGEVIKSFLLKESRDIPMARSAPIVVAERLTDLIAILLLSLLGSVAYRYGWIFIIVSSAAVVLVLLVVTVRTIGTRAVKILTSAPLLKKIEGKIWESYEAAYIMAKPRRLAWPVALSVLAWMAECLAFYFIVKGIDGHHLDLLQATFIYAFSTAAGALAMMPGGLGVTEGGLTGLLLLLSRNGFSAAEASTATILTRAATLWFAVLVGMVSLAVYVNRYMRPIKSPDISI